MPFTIGLDYGTNSVRALLVDTQTGEERATAIYDYPHGDAGIILDPRDPNLARQHPADYLTGAESTIRSVLAQSKIPPTQIIGLGVDTTGSTPMPVDAAGVPLASTSSDPAALAWLWKDHTSHAEAAEITLHAEKHRPAYLAKCGGKYSSEWFWSKLLHCARTAPVVSQAAHTWVEIADWIPASLCGTTHPTKIRRCICAAGHKAFFHTAWGGYPDADFLTPLHPDLARIAATLPKTVHAIGESAGTLSAEWAAKTGLPAGIHVSVGAFDVHLGAVGSGIRPGTLVKIMGTSTCDLMIAPLAQSLPDIPGLCGIVPASVLPGFYGMEAGQSAVGDIFNWFVQKIIPGGPTAGSHEALTAEAAKLLPGESGLLSLDWHNGNRTVLVDPRLTGLILGLNLHTTPAEIYRALIEATAFGARTIMERFQQYNVPVDRLSCGGGIAGKNPMAMQIYADIMNKPIAITQSAQTCALGSAIAAAVAASPAPGSHPDFATAIQKMSTPTSHTFTPNPKAVETYNALYHLYHRLHNAFGLSHHPDQLGTIMKELLNIRDQTRKPQ